MVAWFLLFITLPEMHVVEVKKTYLRNYSENLTLFSFAFLFSILQREILPGLLKEAG
jgi:hypothetical protein